MVWLVGPSCTSVVLQCCCKVSCWSWIQTNGPKLNDVPQKHRINSLERIPCRSSSHPACKFIWNAMSRLINVRPIYWFGNYLTYSATFTISFLESYIMTLHDQSHPWKGRPLPTKESLFCVPYPKFHPAASKSCKRPNSELWFFPMQNMNTSATWQVELTLKLTIVQVPTWSEADWTNNILLQGSGLTMAYHGFTYFFARRNDNKGSPACLWLRAMHIQRPEVPAKTWPLNRCKA